MKKFEMMEVKEAVAFANAGGQALHLHRIIVDREKAPACFVREVDAGRNIAHLFDNDKARLIATAKQLGVRDIFVDREDKPGQHIDLCGLPLHKALRLCKDQQGFLF